MVLTRLVLVLIASGLVLAAAEAAPFSSYGVRAAPAGSQAQVDLSDPKSRRYADELGNAAGQPVNFAGHFVLTTWGCGASCVMGAAVDARTGAVSWLPFTVCCWPRSVPEPLEFRPDSRLLVVHGSRNEEGAGTHDYVFDGHAFTPVPTRR